ncbi:MAG TPA: ATP-dependent 6-phosphofructokinase [Tepidiformaceae bacterium]|nr:ATP-dependent 6-phosphofructokinase [Tepidiformaceae bacterium]
MNRLGILTSGGDAPGMNAAIRAAVRTATGFGMSMVGYRDGFGGFIDRRFDLLDDRSVGNIIQHGGTVLGTSRCPEFLDAAVRARAVEQMREDGVEALITIGGDGTFRGARALELEHGVPVVGVPGTIDNDVFGTDETIGFDTAVTTAVWAIDQLRDTSESTGMIFFVEVMGRKSGAIAINTALAAGAAGVLVPEADEDPREMAERIRLSIARGKKAHIIVVSEGEDEGGAFAMGQRIGAMLEHDYRVVVLGHIQRGGDPTVRDRIIAAQSGARAVDALAQGRSGMMIGMQRGEVVEVPLSVVVEHGHAEPDLDLLFLAQRLSG